MTMTRLTFSILMILAALLLAPGEARPGEGGPGPTTPAPAAAGIAFPNALEAADVTQPRIVDINRHGLVLGNGDLSALLWERQGTLCLRVTKSDVWDARVDTSADPPMLRVDIPNQKWTGGSSSPPSYAKPYPQPRCAAIISIGKATQPGGWQCIRAGGSVTEFLREGDAGLMAVAGAAGVSAGYRQDLAPSTAAAFTALKFRISGSAGARYYVNIYGQAGKALVESGWIDSPSEEREASFPIPPGNEVSAFEIYVMSKSGARAENRIRQITFEGKTAPRVIAPGVTDARIKSARLDLRRAVAELQGNGPTRTTVRALADRNAFLIETDEEVFLEEIKAAELPAAEHGVTDGVRWMRMKLPGDPDYTGMEYALAVASAGRQKAVALVTSFDTRNSVLDEAIRLARKTAAVGPSALVARHEEEWARYWSASGVELDDPDFQSGGTGWPIFSAASPNPAWSRPGCGACSPMTRPGGTATIITTTTRGSLTGLRSSLITPTSPTVGALHERDAPRLRWFARTTYDCEGACMGISTFAFEPDPAKCRSVNRRQIGLVPWGCTLGMAGMSAQILWYCHLYRPDRHYLEERIYPVIREVALFYCSFAEKCPRDAQGKAKFGPSYSPEHGGFGVANVPFDLAYARFTLKAASAAARELGRDEALVARFTRALEILPAYPTAPDATGRPVVVDWTGCKFREIGEHNITVPAVPVFPADQVTWFSPEPEKELFRNTIRQTRHRGCNSTVMFSVAKARLSMLDALDDARRYYRPQVQPNGMFYWPMHGFYLSESVGLASMISEFLVQSVDNIVRVFPCWPKDKDAKFAGLRAQGGFLVSAQQIGGRVTSVRIRSTVGGRLKVLNPWSTLPQSHQNGAVASLTDEGGGVFSLGTTAGGLVELSPQP